MLIRHPLPLSKCKSFKIKPVFNAGCVFALLSLVLASATALAVALAPAPTFAPATASALAPAPPLAQTMFQSVFSVECSARVFVVRDV